MVYFYNFWLSKPIDTVSRRSFTQICGRYGFIYSSINFGLGGGGGDRLSSEMGVASETRIIYLRWQ